MCIWLFREEAVCIMFRGEIRCIMLFRGETLHILLFTTMVVVFFTLLSHGASSLVDAVLDDCVQRFVFTVIFVYPLAIMHLCKGGSRMMVK